MKIFYYFLEYDTPMYGWQRANHIAELTAAGHEVVTFNPASYPDFDAANEAALKRLDAESGWDLFLTCDDQDVIYPSTVSEVSRRGIATCLICWDNLELPFKQRRIAPLFDVVWITSRETGYLFERWGCRRVLFMPYAANPDIYVPHPDATPVRAVGFIGSPYGSRTNKLNDLTAGGVACHVYSNALVRPGFNSSAPGQKSRPFDPADMAVKAMRYMRFPIGRRVLWAAIVNRFSRHARLDTSTPLLTGHASVEFERMCELYSAHTLSLNITELRDTYVLRHPIPKLHLRTFEIPMAGGLQLTTRVAEIEEYFDEGREIVLYSCRDELIDKARYYLDPRRDAEVARMKAAARRRAERDHTWMARFNRIFSELGL